MVLVLSGLPSRAIIGLLALGAVMVLISILVSSYRSDRLFNFWTLGQTRQGTGYQLIHSFKALAAGGIFGVGIGNSYENCSIFLKRRPTSFLLSSARLGLVGAL